MIRQRLERIHEQQRQLIAAALAAPDPLAPDQELARARIGDLEAQERELRAELEAQEAPRPSTPPGRELRQILTRALKTDEPEGLRRVQIRRLDADTRPEKSPRWPSRLPAVQGYSGGFYGFSAIGGPKKAGKTTVAMGSALAAAEAGWSVFYFAGENTDQNLEELVHAYLGSFRAFEHPDWLHERFVLKRFGRRATLEQLVASVADRIWADTERVLIVLDSLNTLARASATRSSPYLDQLGDICAFARTATEESAGRIGVLAISEENQRGGFAGQSIEYAAACLLAVQPRKKDPEKLALQLTSRESPGGFCGIHMRDRDECRLKPVIQLAEREEEDRGAATTGELAF